MSDTYPGDSAQSHSHALVYAPLATPPGQRQSTYKTQRRHHRDTYRHNRLRCVLQTTRKGLRSVFAMSRSRLGQDILAATICGMIPEVSRREHIRVVKVSSTQHL